MYTYPQPRAYEVIQQDIENNLNALLKKSHLDIKQICIVGAWHGHEIGRLLDLYPNCHIYAFEAHPRHFEILKQRYTSNTRVTLYNKAVSSEIGTVRFYDLNYEGCGSMLRFKAEDKVASLNNTVRITEEFDVATTTLQHEFGDLIFDMLWVDVQGAELEVLRGGNLVAYDSLFLEIHIKTESGPCNCPYDGQCHKEDLEEYLYKTHYLYSIGLDNEINNGQGNSFWLKVSNNTAP